MRRLRLLTPLLLGFALAVPAPAAHAQVAIGLSITIAPPMLPIYEQPPLPAPGYIWTPGYWAYGPDGYFWVPGTWILPPAVGLLWTPGYWGWGGGFYAWNPGYWGPEVGYYGGINYGFGYIGIGYAGGYWNHGVFAYNRSVNNFGGVHVTNVYNRTVINNTSNRVGYNGPGGLNVRPTAQQEAFAHQQHVAPTALQLQHQQLAASNRELRASVNGGRPPIAATSRPNEFTGRGVVPARPVAPAATGAPVHPGGAPGPAINRPGTVTPGTQGQHPAGTTQGAPRVTAPAVSHPVAPTQQQQRVVPTQEPQRVAPTQQLHAAPMQQQQRVAPTQQQRAAPAPERAAPQKDERKQP